MRRNITLSFDDGWIKLLDRARGDLPRSRFIEDQISPASLELIAEARESFQRETSRPKAKEKRGRP